MADSSNPMKLTGDMTPVAQGVKANLDALPKATNKLFHTFLGKKHADALRYELLIAAQTEADIKKISAGKATFTNGEIVEKEQPDDAGNVSTSFLQLKMEEDSDNLHGCMREAIRDSLSRNDDVSPTPISEKFFSRWRSEAIHISDQEEQQLWGKVLSEENQKQGTFSLSTIDILRNVDKKMAGIFSTICKYAVFDGDIILGDDYEVDAEINYDALVRLSELGLISMSIPVKTSHNIPTLSFSGKKTHFLEIEPYLVLIEAKEEEKLSYLYARLTTAGKEIRKVAINVNEDTIQDVCRLLFKIKSLENVEKILYGKYNVPAIDHNYEIDVLQSITREMLSDNDQNESLKNSK